MKTFFIVAGVAAVTICGVVWWLPDRRQPVPQAVLPSSKPQPPAPPVGLEPPPVEVAVAPSNDTPVQPPVLAAPQAVKKMTSEPLAPDPRLSDPVVKEALGRVALSYVGADANAENVWYWTINDPNLPDESRKNLIEDLNEDGLSDPKNPGPQDLPLIASRLRLIAELEPYSMDQINQDAFHEAFKDLAKMYVNLTH